MLMKLTPGWLRNEEVDGDEGEGGNGEGQLKVGPVADEVSQGNHEDATNVPTCSEVKMEPLNMSSNYFPNK